MQIELFTLEEPPSDTASYYFEPAADGLRFDIWRNGVLQLRVYRDDKTFLIDAPEEQRRQPRRTWMMPAPDNEEINSEHPGEQPTRPAAPAPGGCLDG